VIEQKIVENCKGLPLAVVLIAGVLKEKVENLDWWKQVGESLRQVGESLGSLNGGEGRFDVLEVVYNQLPEVLKPCFLFLGSFTEDEEIRVKKLNQLWISEGFVQKHENKSLEDVAEVYLMDLVARSLVAVARRIP
jgi:hypothetical protein